MDWRSSRKSVTDFFVASVAVSRGSRGEKFAATAVSTARSSAAERDSGAPPLLGVDHITEEGTVGWRPLFKKNGVKPVDA